MSTATADKPSEELVVIEPGQYGLASVLPALTGDQVGIALRAYRALQSELDKSMPDQIMEISGKPFRKKGYWRAIRTAFQLKVECVKEERQTIATADRGDWGWLVTYRATAPNGCYAEGDGSCFASEKNVGRMAATEHNVRSHAHTRAFNRAVSNLVGFGEVSAEEVGQGERRGEKTETPRGISEAQAKRLLAIAGKAGWAKDALMRWLESVGVTVTNSADGRIDPKSLTTIARSNYERLCAIAEDGPNGEFGPRDDDPPF